MPKPNNKDKYKVCLSKKQREELLKFVKQGKKSAREITRARILLLSDERKNIREITEILKIHKNTVCRARKKYFNESSLKGLTDDPRSGAPIKIDKRVESHIATIACSTPPEGQKEWTMRMISDKLVELELVNKISHVTVHRTLKKMN